ncbi:MAG TPA: xanthine dehydrogenase family protein subunit M [Gemmatimonadaceae bacterium]|nr:xanthine dehydrogenase family protein subunit M [Gemmatimonadaceae bacterium]
MHPFEYERAASLPDAVRRLAAPRTSPMSGGTDLLVLLKEDLARPDALVDLRYIAGASDITKADDGGVRIGAAVRVNTLATNVMIRERFPALASACAAVGTTALRHMGTIGGNLCQRPRCWYFRRNIPCLKNGGDTCPAATGENQYLAILGGGPCYIVHPSDPAVALTALEATVEIAGPNGTRTVPIEMFYVLPAERLDGETVLAPGEFVSAVTIPAASAGGWQRYDKLMQRGSWDFALVSLAAVKRQDGDVRLVLGGVAPTPWRVTSSIEEDVASGNLDESDVATLAERALYDARPLAGNAYKVELAKALLRRAIADMSAM